MQHIVKRLSTNVKEALGSLNYSQQQLNKLANQYSNPPIINATFCISTQQQFSIVTNIAVDPRGALTIRNPVNDPSMY